MIDFTDFTFLKAGNIRQVKAYNTLENNKIIYILKDFDPIVTGTIPIAIDIDNSDLDIICFLKDKISFIDTINLNFKNMEAFKISEKFIHNIETVIVRFYLESFLIEIFSQPIPSIEQYAYRHMIIEYQLLNKYGENFRNKIIELKKLGYKTEPSFAKALGLEGDPYTELLKIKV